MFDKIFVIIKDIVIYVLPGLLTTSCLFILFGYDINKLQSITNSNFLYIIIAFSFVFGFILSQLQIIFFWSLPRKKTYKTIDGCFSNLNIKERIVAQVIKTFEFEQGIDNEKILSDPEIIELCCDYVKIHSTNDSFLLIERDSYLSSFAISIYFPTVFSIFAFLKYVDIVFSTIWLIITLIISIGFLFMLINKIAVNFKIGRNEKILHQFMILSLQNNLKQNILTKSPKL